MSGRLKQLKGLRFGRLLVIDRSGTRVSPNGCSKPLWRCLCDCGNEIDVIGQALRNGSTQSCGCLQREVMSTANLTHGMSDSAEYQSWRAMRERCNNPNNSHYHIYGGAGITYSHEWDDFEIFLLDMGLRPSGSTLDRYPDRSGHYGPANCRWATPMEQSRNTSRTDLITWCGVTMCRKDWADKLGITTVALKFRIKNWGIEKAMTLKKTGRGGRPSKLKDSE